MLDGTIITREFLEREFPNSSELYYAQHHQMYSFMIRFDDEISVHAAYMFDFDDWTMSVLWYDTNLVEQLFKDSPHYYPDSLEPFLAHVNDLMLIEYLHRIEEYPFV